MKIHYLFIPVLLAAVVGFTAAPVFAEQGSNNASSSSKKEEREHKALEKLLRQSGPRVQIGEGGRAQLDAVKVTASSGSEMTVGVFGLSFKVKTDSATEWKGASSTPAVGSTLWIKGKVDTSTGVITAASVRGFLKGTGSSHMGSTTPNLKRLESFDKELKALLEQVKKLTESVRF